MDQILYHFNNLQCPLQCKNLWGVDFSGKEFKTKKDMLGYGKELFDAALTSGYTKMLMFDKNKKLHPEHEAADTKMWQSLYNPDTFEIGGRDLHILLAPTIIIILPTYRCLLSFGRVKIRTLSQLKT